MGALLFFSSWIYLADEMALVPSYVCGTDVDSARTMVLWCMQ